MRAIEFINEAFNQPYSFEWDESDYGAVDAVVNLPDGTDLSVMFSDFGDGEWHVEFWRGASQGVTGLGDAQRIFATVLSAIQQFIKKRHPETIVFSATKEVEPGQNAESRARLYNSLVARYAKAWGYDAYNEDHGDQVTYELTKINNQNKEDSLNELYEPETSFPLKWFNDFAPKERVARAYDRKNRYIDIMFTPVGAGNVDAVEISFSRNDDFGMTGEGDANRVFATVLEAIREYLRGYQPKILLFGSKGESRTKLYKSLINRFAKTVGYKQFDTSKLSPESLERISGSGAGDLLVLRKTYV